MRASQKLAGLTLLWLGVGPVAEAVPTPAVTITNPSGFSLTNPPFTLGWAFETNMFIAVTDLGVFDSSQDGLAESHEIGLWDDGGNLLATTIVGEGTAGVLVNQFRYESIAPLGLSPGIYTIGSLYPSSTDEPLVFPRGATGFASAPAVAFLSPLYAAGAVLTLPTSSAGIDIEPGYFGPNFRFEAEAAPIPEPGSLMLLGGGLLSMATLSRARRVGSSSSVGVPYGGWDRTSDDANAASSSNERG